MRIIILCKAPVIGQVKTRLMDTYSAPEAALFHQQMAATVLNKVLSVEDDVWLATDDMNHEFFKHLQSKYDFTLKQQSAGNLGHRLIDLMQQSQKKDAKPILFLGTDSPHVQPSRYMQAKAQLIHSDVVIGPVEDGGYDLIAFNSPHSCLFEDINWGSETVLVDTLNICNINKLTTFTLSESFDIDRPQDLERAPPSSW